MLLDKLRQSMNNATKVAMKAINDLNDEKITKFPSQKDVPREELVKLCQILKLQQAEAMRALEASNKEKQAKQFIDATTNTLETNEENNENENVEAPENDGSPGQAPDGTHANHVRAEDNEKEVTKEASNNANSGQVNNQDTKDAGTSTHAGRAEDGTRANTTKANDARPVCKFHKYKKCLHKKSCKFSHPKLCNKFLQFGFTTTNPQKGCKKEDCDLYHPFLCYFSTKYKECRVKNCKKRHLPGTKLAKVESVKEQKPMAKKKVPSNKPSHRAKSAQKFSRDPVTSGFQAGSRTYASVAQGPPVQANTEHVQNYSFLGQMTPGLLEQRVLELSKQLVTKALLAATTKGDLFSF